MTHWQLQPIMNNYFLVAVLAAIMLALLFFVRPAFASLLQRRRMILFLLRGSLILLVVLGMLRPTRVTTQTRDQKSTLIWLVDKSRSMLIPDAEGGRPRWEAARAAIERSLPELEPLAAKLDAQFYMFDELAEAVGNEGGQFQWPDKPDGNQSDIGSALYDVIRDQRGNRIAGVILLSDGAQRALAPRVNLQQPAMELARLDTPLYTVTIGLPRDQSQSRDVAIEDVQDQYTVFVNNEFVLPAAVRIEGFAGRKVPVRLNIEKPGGETESLGPIEVSGADDSEQNHISFRYTPKTPGQYKLTVAAEPQPGELVTANNSLTAFLSVLGGGLRVLYLHGDLGQEHKFLQRSVDESAEIQLDSQWIDSRRRSQWPINLGAIVADRDYDVYVLADLDFTALGNQSCTDLAEKVQQGKGLMMLGGAHSFGPGGYQPSALAKVLPIKMGQFERQSFDQPIREDVHLTSELQMLPTENDHFITHLAGRDSNMERWRTLSPLLGANRFGGVKQRGALVLAQAEDESPLLVAGQYGAGRVLAFAGDSTYRWYRHGKQAEHKRFWRQVILWLAKKEDSDQQDVWVRLDQRRYPQGSRVEFELGARNKDGDPILDTKFDVLIISPDGQQQAIQASRDDQQWRGSAGPFETAGNYTLRVTANRDGSELGSAERQFAIQATDLELVDPAANPSQLEMLARLTSDAGGRALAPEELPALIREIGENPPQAKITYQSKWQLTDKKFDAWAMFLCAIALVSCEWYLRKRWGLV